MVAVALARVACGRSVLSSITPSVFHFCRSESEKALSDWPCKARHIGRTQPHSIGFRPTRGPGFLPQRDLDTYRSARLQYIGREKRLPALVAYLKSFSSWSPLKDQVLPSCTGNSAKVFVIIQIGSHHIYLCIFQTRWRPQSTPIFVRPTADPTKAKSQSLRGRSWKHSLALLLNHYSIEGTLDVIIRNFVVGTVGSQQLSEMPLKRVRKTSVACSQMSLFLHRELVKFCHCFLLKTLPQFPSRTKEISD